MIKFDLYQESGVKEDRMVCTGGQNVMVFLLQDSRYIADQDYSRPREIPVRTLPGCSIDWELQALNAPHLKD